VKRHYIFISGGKGEATALLDFKDAP